MSEKTNENEQINVALFGRSGYGKSSIANMLVQGDIYRNNNTFTINDCASEEPINIYDYVTETYQVFDTAGIDELSSQTISNKEAIKIIRNYFSDCEVPLNYIFYVHKKGRISGEDVKMFKIFKEIFDWGEKNIIIIITHAKSEWVEKNLDLIREDFGDYPVIPVDFPIADEDEDDNIQKDKRLRSLQHLENKLSELSYKAVRLEVSNPTQIIRKSFSKIISVLLIGGSISLCLLYVRKTK